MKRKQPNGDSLAEEEEVRTVTSHTEPIIVVVGIFGGAVRGTRFVVTKRELLWSANGSVATREGLSCGREM